MELHLSAALLAELAAGGVAICGEWAGVVADIAGQYARRERRQQDLNSRLLGAALRRHTQVRDRTCTFIGCRRAVTTAEQDHTYDHDLGGVTVRANLGPVCAHDHGVKHRRGWNVTQPESGTFTWTSPLGGVYRTRCEPLLPLMPDPAPIALGPESDLPAAVDEGPILNRPPGHPASVHPRRGRTTPTNRSRSERAFSRYRAPGASDLAAGILSACPPLTVPVSRKETCRWSLT